MIFQFNQITLDTAQYRLCTSNDPISVEPQVFDLLVYLIENRERVVTRDELLDNLWKGKVVTDSALGARLKGARKAVDDSGKRQQVIQTIHGRGYQFIAGVKESKTSKSQEKNDVLTTIETLALPGKPSIAVLPFDNLSDDEEQEYFSDGITEDIITGLSRFRELFVIARGSSFAFKDRSVDIIEVAEKLGAEYVLEGSVQKGENRVRITAQLIDGSTGNHIWAEYYDRVLEDVFAVQDDVAQTIISTLVGRLEEENRERAWKKKATNLSAYDYYLRGKHYWPDWRGSKDSKLRAREMFEKAMEIDPDYASAYIGLAESYIAEFWSSWTKNRKAAGVRAFKYARKALELDNSDSHAHLILASVYIYVKSNFELAGIQIQRALELNPNDYWNYCLKTKFALCTGDFEESIHWGNEAIRRNPFLPDDCLHSMGFSEYFSQQYDDAIKTFGRLSTPGVEVQGCIAACYAQLGRDKDACAAATEFRDRADAELTGQRDWDTDSWRNYWSGVYNFKAPELLKPLLDGLHKAGLPV